MLRIELVAEDGDELVLCAPVNRKERFDVEAEHPWLFGGRTIEGNVGYGEVEETDAGLSLKWWNGVCMRTSLAGTKLEKGAVVWVEVQGGTRLSLR